MRKLSLAGDISWKYGDGQQTLVETKQFVVSVY